jgi:riboflavin kinase / FMN adenylyltransferase
VEIIRDPENSPELEQGHVVTIGAYDGVHLGHRAVIRATQQKARSLDLDMAVVTFDPHPAYLLRPSHAPKLLTDTAQKLELLDECGVDTVVVVPFDHQRASQRAPEFIEDVLVRFLKVRAITVGHDFRFGAERSGNVDVLRALGEQHHFDVEGVQLLPRPDGKVESITSTAIRQALTDGDVDAAARMLGRHHEIRGDVVKGDQRGRTIGFRTANVAVPQEMALPADGVYAAWYLGPDDEKWPAAVNIGKRPTFYRDAEHSLVEAHLIDFEGDLYDQPARVQMVERIRSERRFDGLDALKEQLQCDIGSAREILASEGASD